MWESYVEGLIKRDTIVQLKFEFGAGFKNCNS